ncbi:MAG: DUF192 domain-containing protein [Betaproteobacteria bacterium]|nr:MAG: DUF192 domain-containing protein [Betaproteobacteria bacterium]TMG77623.1 MAG: DUF192 domain-containing protein [Betaproteobacteria bacterium]
MSRLGLKIGVCAGVVAAATAFAQMPTVELSAGIHLIRAEVAYTFETRAQGLMFRKALGPNEGMFFVFPRAEIYCMWMKNTLIPLSVAFVDEKGKIVSISDMQPQTETSHCAAAPAKFALEMPAGWFAKKGIKSGTTIQGLEKAPAAR